MTKFVLDCLQIVENENGDNKKNVLDVSLLLGRI